MRRTVVVCLSALALLVSGCGSSSVSTAGQKAAQETSEETGTKAEEAGTKAEEAKAFFALYLLFIAGVGEYVCLRALYVGNPPGHSTRPVVAISLFASGLTLAYQQLKLAVAKRPEARDETDNASFRLYSTAFNSLSWHLVSS